MKKKYRLNKKQFVTFLLTVLIFGFWAWVGYEFLTTLIEHPNW